MKQKLLLYPLLLMGMVQGAMAQEPYAALSEGNTKLTFYYDKQKNSHEGTIYTIDKFRNKNNYGDNAWNAYARDIVEVEFDSSFADFGNVTSTAYWFAHLWNLTKISGMENLNTSSITDMSFMFSGCEKLTNIDLSHFNTSQVTDMDWMFAHCESLETLDVSCLDVSNVTDMSGMFIGCSKLTSLDVTSFNTSKVTNMISMFSGCSSLCSLDLKSFDTKGVTIMSDMFSGCSNLDSLDLKNFDTSNVFSMDMMFWRCSKLANLDITNFDTSKLDYIVDLYAMFADCSSLIELDLSSFNTSNATNMNYMFSGCSQLKKIYISEKWTTNKITQSTNMFTGCTSLVGGNGTAYDASHTDHEYARIDKAGQPGYLTQKGSTGIESLSTAPVQGEEAWYTLDGRRVETPTKGVNVKNGRKVVVK